MFAETLLMFALLILIAAGYIALRIRHERQVREWIAAGLIQRKPREFSTARRYK